MDLAQFSSATVSVGELLETQDRLEKEAADVLGFNIDECTHEKGHICQPVYSCVTCRAESGEYAGVCAACSVQCHGSHELVELLQRRHFQCDCGTLRLGEEADCKLDKRYGQDNNTDNRYDHNFEGIFCVCKAPYDPDKEESDMYQCVICEDWFHKRCEAPHLAIPDDDWDQYICAGCVQGPAAPLLRRWAGVPGRGILLIKADGSVRGLRSEMPSLKRPAAPDSTEPESKRPKLDENATPQDALAYIHPSLQSEGQTACRAPPPSDVPIRGPILLEENWRDHWCRCPDCLPSFDGLGMLLEADDVYEPAPDPDAGKSLVQLGLEALQDLPRERVIEGLHRYNDLRDGLLKHLAPISATGDVVTKESIEEFFAQQRAKDAAP